VVRDREKVCQFSSISSDGSEMKEEKRKIAEGEEKLCARYFFLFHKSELG
jgi:hypothetical protein